MSVPALDHHQLPTPDALQAAQTLGQQQPAHRIPSLDGIRAISIALVLISHSAGFVVHQPRLKSLFDVGNLGVRVFFVLSGFLITSLLHRELETTKSISLWNFYKRRALRIFPAFYVMLAIVYGLKLLERTRSGDFTCLAGAALYVSNYVGCSWDLGHTWSLAVEEQFYLIWPLALSLLGVARARRVAMAILVLSPLARYVLVHAGVRDAAYRFECVADALAVGCLLALLREDLLRNARIRALLETRASWLLVPLAFIVQLWGPHPSLYGGRVDIYAAAAPSLLNILIACAVLWCLHSTSGVAARILNHPTVVSVGTMSYSIYLWQQPFLNETRLPAIDGWLRIALALSGALLLSAMSFRFVETPFLRLRARWNL